MVYRSTHPLLSSEVFDSWQELCDAAIEAGEKQAQADLQEAMTKLTFLYSDAIIALSDGDFEENGGH